MELEDEEDEAEEAPEEVVEKWKENFLLTREGITILEEREDRGEAEGIEWRGRELVEEEVEEREQEQEEAVYLLALLEREEGVQTVEIIKTMTIVETVEGHRPRRELVEEGL